MTSQGTLNGIAGVHLVAAELSLRGYSVAITARNTPGIDLLATSPRTGKTYSVQVKTNAQERIPHFWLLGSHPVRPRADLFYVFVNVRRPPKFPEFYVVPSVIVKRYSRKRRNRWRSFYREKCEKTLYRWSRLR